jgi:Na+/H+ antiporter NhaD/arsenite permease-like protein
LEPALLVEFIIFALMLVGIAAFHERTLAIALAGTASLLIYKVFATDLNIVNHLGHESALLLNLLGLLLGFALLAKHFEETGLPHWLPQWLPPGWMGGFILLVLVAVLSTFLDNIAGAMIGGVMAKAVFNNRVALSYVVALVAASNAGGAGSVIGDTTTTMMWLAGVPATAFFKAFIGAAVAITLSGVIAAKAQHNLQPVTVMSSDGVRIDTGRLVLVVLAIILTIGANVAFDAPAVGLWAGLLLGALMRSTPWKELQHAYQGALFLLLLVLSASLLPVKSLPEPSWQTAFGLGLLSAVFDNIPLTALAMYQGGYDWGMLAFTVGYGGSLIWFGSSAGVAITNMFPETKSSIAWIKQGWHVPVAYVLSFFVLLAAAGWRP